MKTLNFWVITWITLISFVSCSSEYDDYWMIPTQNESSADSAVYSTTNRTRQDTTTYHAGLSPQTTRLNNCTLDVQSYLMLEGWDNIDKPPTLKVTISDIIIRLNRDKTTDSIVYCRPYIISSVLEPSESASWGELPDGLTCKAQSLMTQPVTFSYDNSYEASVTIHYIVRVKDEALATGYTYSYECVQGTLSSDIHAPDDVICNIPIKLTAVQFDASVSPYN